jgi:hypothetical protein
MLARLSRSSLSRFNGSSRVNSDARVGVQRPLKTVGRGKKVANSKPLSRLYSPSHASLFNLHTRSFATKSEIVEAQLVSAVRDFNVDSTAQFDALLLEDLLERNGWDLELVDGKVSLHQSFADASVKIEVLTETPAALAENPLLEEGEEGHHHHDHHHHHHHGHEDTEHADLGVLKGQMDYFNIVISKRKVGEKLIFSCHAKEGVLEIDSVTLAHSAYNPSKPSFAVNSSQISSISSEITGDINNRILAFADLPETLQASFEEYLQQHGINHDLALIIYYSLFKHDLQYDQEWAVRTQNFLSSK